MALAHAVAPLYAIQQGLYVLSLKNESNCIKRDAPKVRNRVIKITEDIPLDKFKMVCKKYGCTVNEAI